MAVVTAAIIETLGLTTVYVALWIYDYNSHKRKTDPSAPFYLSVALGIVYLIATLGLIIFLEVWPSLAIYAPAIFPFLAVVGALNLAMIARQEEREEIIREEKAERKRERDVKKEEPKVSVVKPTTWQGFLDTYPNMLEMTGKEIQEKAGIPICAKTATNWKIYAKRGTNGGHA